MLDTAPAEILDGLTELAATLCGTPIALITLIDVNRQWFKARYGTQLRETRRDDAFSAHAILQPEMLVVRDAMADARFTADPLVRDELKIRFYAGAPLIAPEGVTLGTLCVIDHRPRDLTSSQKRALQLICDQAMAWLDAQRQGVSRSDAVRTETGSPPVNTAAEADIAALEEAERKARDLNRELEQRVEQQARELALANRELETFTYTVSHDLKAPLRGIDGYSRLLLEDYGAKLDQEGRTFLHNIRDGVDRMGQLIDDLLTYSRMERRVMHTDQVDLAGLVTQIINERRRDIDESHAEVSLSVDVPDLRADVDGLRLALRNLVDNALKFRRPNHAAKIAIRARNLPGSTEIDIEDNGIGFDMRFHDRIFDIFQRLHRAEEFPGTGIGLAIVHKALQRMGGSVHAHSRPGQGSTFTLEIPR